LLDGRRYIYSKNRNIPGIYNAVQEVDYQKKCNHFDRVPEDITPIVLQPVCTSVYPPEMERQGDRLTRGKIIFIFRLWMHFSLFKSRVTATFILFWTSSLFSCPGTLSSWSRILCKTIVQK